MEQEVKKQEILDFKKKECLDFYSECECFFDADFHPEIEIVDAINKIVQHYQEYLDNNSIDGNFKEINFNKNSFTQISEPINNLTETLKFIVRLRSLFNNLEYKLYHLEQIK